MLSQKTKPLLRPDPSSKNKIWTRIQEIEKQPNKKKTSGNNNF
jgi:hypothetical protein